MPSTDKFATTPSYYIELICRPHCKHQHKYLNTFHILGRQNSYTFNYEIRYYISSAFSSDNAEQKEILKHDRMKSLKKNAALLILCFSHSLVNAQYEIKPEKGYTPQIGIMVDMLEELKDRLIEDIHDLEQAETDYLFDDKANSIGAIIMHLVATEAYFQVETLEERTWTDEEAEFWGIASGLGAESRDRLKEKPIKYYLDLWDQVREKTLEGLKAKNDAWFAASIDESMNNHWAWFHILEHQANHMGQIALVKKRLPE